MGIITNVSQISGGKSDITRSRMASCRRGWVLEGQSNSDRHFLVLARIEGDATENRAW